MTRDKAGGLTLVVGATGTLGREIVSGLLARSRPVRALVRDLGRARRLLPGEVQLLEGDARDMAATRAAVEGAARVVSALGGPVQPSLTPWASFFRLDVRPHRTLIDAAVEAGAERFAYVSVVGAGERGRGAYLDAHTAVEELLADADLASTVVRPTGFHSAFVPFLDLARRGFAPLLGSGAPRTNPIAEAGLAAAVLEALDDERALVFARIHEEDCIADAGGQTTLADYLRARAAARGPS